MAFRFNWPRFDQRFVDHASEQLERALNREGEGRPSKIAGRIEVKEMDLGTKPPELEMLEIGELTDEKFRGIFKLTYNGDAYLILQTQVQANPLQPPKPTHPRTLRPRTAPLAASSPLLVPMTIRISCLRLRGIAALVVDRHKGVTLSFKTDPLDSVQVSSSFDGVDNVRRFLQATIENQLRKLFADDLPNLIHGISLQMMSQVNAGKGNGTGPSDTIHTSSSSTSSPDLHSDSTLPPSAFDNLAREARRADARRRGIHVPSSAASSASSSDDPDSASTSRHRHTATASVTIAAPSPTRPPRSTAGSSSTSPRLGPSLDSGFFGDIAADAERYYFTPPVAVGGEPVSSLSLPHGSGSHAGPAAHERWWSSSAPTAPIGAGPVGDTRRWSTRWVGNEPWEALRDLGDAAGGGDGGEFVLHRGLNTPLARSVRGKGKGKGWGAAARKGGVARTVGLLVPGPGEGLAGVGDLMEHLECPAALTRAQIAGLRRRGSGPIDGSGGAGDERLVRTASGEGLWTVSRRSSGGESGSETASEGWVGPGSSRNPRSNGSAVGSTTGREHHHAATSPGSPVVLHPALSNHSRASSFPQMVGRVGWDSTASEGFPFPSKAAPGGEALWRFVRPLHPPIRRPVTPLAITMGSTAEVDLARPVVLSTASGPAVHLTNLCTWPLTISPHTMLPDLVAYRTTPRPPGRKGSAVGSPAAAPPLEDLRGSLGTSRTTPVPRRIRRVKLPATAVPGVGLWPATSPTNKALSPNKTRGSLSRAASAVAASETDDGSEAGSSWDGAGSVRSEPAMGRAAEELRAWKVGAGAVSVTGAETAGGPAALAWKGYPLSPVGIGATSPATTTPPRLTTSQVVSRITSPPPLPGSPSPLPRSPLSTYGAGLAISHPHSPLQVPANVGRELSASAPALVTVNGSGGGGGGGGSVEGRKGPGSVVSSGSAASSRGGSGAGSRNGGQLRGAGSGASEVWVR